MSVCLPQGVLHNPKNDKRTTAGVFHVTEGGLPVSHDKKAVPMVPPPPSIFLSRVCMLHMCACVRLCKPFAVFGMPATPLES